MRRPEPRVLVVASNDDTRAVHALLLRRSGFMVCTRPTGASAVRWLERAAAVCLVLLDEDLTYAGWLQVIRQLAQDPRLAEVPVAIVSADPTVRAVARRLRVHVLAKPVSPLSLERLAGAHCDARDVPRARGRARAAGGRHLLH